MLGCDLENVMYGKADNDVLQGRFDDDNLEGVEEMNCMLEEEMMLFSQDLMMTFLVAGKGNDELYGEAGNDCLRVEMVLM